MAVLGRIWLTLCPLKDMNPPAPSECSVSQVLVMILRLEYWITLNIVLSFVVYHCENWKITPYILKTNVASSTYCRAPCECLLFLSVCVCGGGG